VDANIQHYFQAPLTTYPNLLDPSGPPITYPSTTNQTSSGLFQANQTLFSSNLYLAAINSKDLRKQASQNTELTKIDTYVGVAKAFFDVLLTDEQLNVLDEDILRLQRNYKDSYNLYKDGLTDNIDYQRAGIALSNVQAQRRSVNESVKSKYALLKQLMGVPREKQFTVSFDSSLYEKEILIDTARVLDYKGRVEYQSMQTALNLQGEQIRFYRSNFIPSLSAYYQFIPEYGSEQFSDLYAKTSSSSVVGLKLTYPLFQGFSRFQGLSKAKLQYRRLQVGTEYLKNVISSEYTNALSQYVSNLDEMKVANNNVTIARNIYKTVKYQYDKGIKAYLEVIVSETDLRTAELNYLDRLFQVLSSKLDLEKALGSIQPK
jgi:outer membrane protein TolC